MCGIYGLWCSDGVGDIDGARDRLAHRGPDGAGTWVDLQRTLALGHRRLAILDLTDESRQPFVSDDGRYVLVYNGEVYNFEELRAELGALGHRFRTTGDTEVVLAAYRQWGEACLGRFNGMFALAIWDAGTEGAQASLFLARDRLGKKPLYYAQTAGRFEFSSELKAMRLDGRLDLDALNAYLAFGYVPFDQCIAAGVKKLPPGHAARLTPGQGTLAVRQWWEAPAFRGQYIDDDEAQAVAWGLLKDSVRLRLRSDVPVGLFLSGGLDSSLVTAAAAEVADVRLRSFTIAVRGSVLDESARAQRIAEHFGTDHQVLEAEGLGLGLLDDFAQFIDEPLADSSVLPTFAICRATRQAATVALGGDGGDEVFGGYPYYARLLQDEARFGWLPGWSLGLLGVAAAVLPAGLKGRNRCAGLRHGPREVMIWESPFFDPSLRRRILSPDLRAAIGAGIETPELRLRGRLQDLDDPAEAQMRLDLERQLPDDFLVKVDRASMAVGLEVRSPFLDYRLVEWMFGVVPARLKVSQGGTRLLQRRIARAVLPAGVDLDRKQGFSIPMDAWLRQAGDFSLVNERLEGLLRPDAVRQLEQGLMRGRANGARLFALLVLAHAVGNLGLAW